MQYIVEFYDFDRSENTMTGPSYERAVLASSPLDAVIRCAQFADPEVTEISCSDGEVVASAYSDSGCCEFEFHLYVDFTDVSFTLPEMDGMALAAKEGSEKQANLEQEKQDCIAASRDIMNERTPGAADRGVFVKRSGVSVDFLV